MQARWFALALAAVAGPGLAQSPQGNTAMMNYDSYGKQAGQQRAAGIPIDQDTRDSFRQYSTMIDYGRCISKVSKRRVRDAMVVPVASPDETALYRDIVAQGQGCRGNLNPAMALNRGVLAEGLYHQGKGVSGPLQPTDPGYKAFLASEANRGALLTDNDQRVMAAMACLVAQQPVVADQVLATRHGSAEEEQAMNALYATAPGCAGPQRQANLSRAYLRAFIANAAYHYQLFRNPANG